jgi:hypothetical protein
VFILGVQLERNVTLSTINNFSAPLPTAKSGEGYLPSGAAPDPTNLLVIAVAPVNGNFQRVGLTQLATYTSQSDGSLTTNSTYANMPATEAGGDCNTCYVTDYWMSPSGKFLAVAGTSGLQIFRFNSANPITRFTGLLTKDSINQLFWDNANHLYAISAKSGKLFVFTVTSQGAVEASGSPHTIASPSSLIVLPK